MTNELMEFEKLENALLRAGREMEYPATPAIAARVREELMPGASPTLARSWSRLLVPIAVAIVLALVLLFALPTARDAVSQFLGLRGLQIFYLTPTPTPTMTGTAAPTVVGTSTTRTAAATPRPTMTLTVNAFVQCCETTLDEAKRRASFPLLLPPEQTPTKVHYQRIFDDGEQVIMVFGDPDNPEFTLYQAQRWVYGKLMAKGLGEQTMLAETTVNGERALWFSGAPHVLVTMDQFGRQNFDMARVVDANTLVWETGDMDVGVIYRIETRRTMEEARKFANELVEEQQ